MTVTRWYLQRGARTAELVVEMADGRGLVMEVVSRREALDVLPYLRGELLLRLARAEREPRTHDPADVGP